MNRFFAKSEVGGRVAFYLSTNGHLQPYQFDYLQGQDNPKRLDKTKIHSETEKPHSVKMFFDQADLFAIDIMNHPVIAMTSEVQLEEIRNLMKNKDIRHIPILNGKKLIGMISDRDLLKLNLSGVFSFLKAREVMTTIVLVVDEETPIAQIAKVLVEEKISALPVIDKDHNLVGMISRTDILKAVVDNRLVQR